MRRRNLYIALTWLVSIAVAEAAISTDQIKRLQNAADVVRALRTQPDNGIPENLWDKAECVVVIPGLKKAAFGVGGEYGKGVMSCRNTGRWSAPLFMQLAKGSWGLQIGATEIDLVLLVMNREGADKLLGNKVALGADASAAAGPVGRAAAAGTDLQMRAEILSYSRARGVFAGIDISGGVLGPDKDANTDVYGADKDPKTFVSGNVPSVPEAQPFLKALAMPVAATSSRR
jgi:SH3 domain-containing YSC84-like protein 1